MAVMLYFKESSNMEAAYGFSITIAMLMTTTLMYYYMKFVKKWIQPLIILVLIIFISVESSFFIANVAKIKQRWMFLIFEFGIIFTMYVWYKARKITNRFLHFVPIVDHIQALKDLSEDNDVRKYATHLVYLTKANNPRNVEQKILNSIFGKQPKRADVYWFVHIDRTDEPYTIEYSVQSLEKDKVIRIEFRLGFRIQTRINIFFKKVMHEMICSKELTLHLNKYEALQKYELTPDILYVIIEKFLSIENEFTIKDGFILNAYFSLKQMAQSEQKAFGLDNSDTVIEMIPLIVTPPHHIDLRRVP
jgi:KUP system potassium uptake protein